MLGERLELSRPRTLVPKTSASTNSATRAGMSHDLDHVSGPENLSILETLLQALDNFPQKS